MAATEIAIAGVVIAVGKPLSLEGIAGEAACRVNDYDYGRFLAHRLGTGWGVPLRWAGGCRRRAARQN